MAPRTFIRSTILVVGLLIGFSLPISLAIGPRWVAMAGFGLLLVPLVLLVGIRRRMLEAAFQSRLRERMDEMVHPVDPGQPAPPRTLREIP